LRLNGLRLAYGVLYSFWLQTQAVSWPSEIKQLILPVKSSHSQATSSRSNAVYMGFRPSKGNHAIYKEIKQFTRKVKQCKYISKIKQISRYNYFTVCEEMVNAIFCSTRSYEKKRKKLRAPTVMWKKSSRICTQSLLYCIKR
jgi:hypothetical protein